MNTNTASQILQQMSVILKKMPNMELLSALEYIEYLVDTASQSSKDVISTAPQLTSSLPVTTSSPYNLLAQLQHVDTPELEQFIRTSCPGKNKAPVQALAQQLNLHFTNRTTKENLIDMIVTHIQMNRMHSMIRTYQSNSSSNELEASIL